MKKCIICDDPAQYAIKSTKDYYCKDCASEQFGDLSYLISIEEATTLLKEEIEIVQEESEINREE